jgi:hypothetical protein
MNYSVGVHGDVDRKLSTPGPRFEQEVPVQTTGQVQIPFGSFCGLHEKSINRGEDRMFIVGWGNNSFSKLIHLAKTIACALLLLPVLWMSACGSGSNSHSKLPVTIQVTPGTSTVSVGQSQAFTATVSNASNSGVIWSVPEGAAGGSITSAGVYTAPMKAGSYHVVASSLQDSTKRASAAIAATAPAPAFTSVAPVVANEGDVYTYSVVATDPVNTGIAFSLVSGPAGATIGGNMLTWTPTHAQSRAPIAFDILATTAAGGTADQKFTITPTGTIRGIATDTYMTASGYVTSTEDLTTSYIGVSFLNGSSWTTVQGIGNADGAFTVPGVPAGSYWLAIASGGYWTSASDLDLGQDFLGRPDGITASNGTSLSLSVLAMDAWQTDNLLDIYNPNLRQDFDWSDNINSGDTSFASVWNWTGPLNNASRGDAWFVTQTETKTARAATWRYLSKATPAIAFTQSDGASADLSGSLGTPAQLTVHMAVLGSQFAGLASTVGSSATMHSTTIGVYTQPFSALKGAVGELEDLLETQDQTPLTQDADFGDITLGNPFPASWTPFVALTYEINVPFTATGASSSVDVPAELYLSTTQMPTKAAPLAPAITPALNIKLNGTVFTERQTGVALTPALSWDPPAVGVPSGYRVTIYQLSAVGSTSGYQPVLDLFTKEHSVVIPDGVLGAGNEYFFAIRAYLIPAVDFTMAPYHGAFPWSHADMFTPVVATSGTAPGAVKAGPSALQHVLRGPNNGAPRVGNARHQNQRLTPRMKVDGATN